MKGAVIWFTGYSGSGKSTLAERLCAHLRGRGLPVELLDGDALRAQAPQMGFSKADRDQHVRRTGLAAADLESRGVVAVAALISPYAEARSYARGLCRNFVEIHVSTPLEVCRQRDPKGLYARAARGELKGLTGVDDPYEHPENPDLAVDTSRSGVDEAAAAVISFVEARLGLHGTPR